MPTVDSILAESDVVGSITAIDPSTLPLTFMAPGQGKVVTFYPDGRCVLGDNFRDHPDEAAAKFLDAVIQMWPRRIGEIR